MIKKSLNYALALFEISKEEEKVQKYYDEVLLINEVFQQNPDFISFLKDYSISLEKKEEIIDKAFYDNQINELIVNLIKLLVKKHKIIFWNEIFQKYESMVFDELHIIKGYAYSAFKLTKTHLKQLENLSNKKIGKKVVLENVIDKELIAGVKVVVGSYIFENTVVSQLEQIKKYIMKGGN